MHKPRLSRNLIGGLRAYGGVRRLKSMERRGFTQSRCRVVRSNSRSCSQTRVVCWGKGWESRNSPHPRKYKRTVLVCFAWLVLFLCSLLIYILIALSFAGSGPVYGLAPRIFPTCGTEQKQRGAGAAVAIGKLAPTRRAAWRKFYPLRRNIAFFL